MFSGIIEVTAKIIEVLPQNQSVQIKVARPHDFDDLKNGDSIATNGVCLTVEKFDKTSIQFSLGYETIQVLKLKVDQLVGRTVNLERSLRFGDRIHGHLVTGHVDSLGLLTKKNKVGDNLILRVQLSKHLAPYIWKKGSVTLHGVSLTVNEVYLTNSPDFELEVCLIPETLKRTNLDNLKVGDAINIEPDYFAKALYNFSQQAATKTSHKGKK